MQAPYPAQQPYPPQPPYPVPPHGMPGYGPVPIVNNLGWAIGGLLTCWPFGIPALIKALEVNTLWARGLYQQAEFSAAEAKKWGKIGVIVGAGLLGAYLLFIIVYFVVIIGVIGVGVSGGL
ncbi:CD225/dispanin family protein [Saccharopolyspora spinosporotrichia]